MIENATFNATGKYAINVEIRHQDKSRETSLSPRIGAIHCFCEDPRYLYGGKQIEMNKDMYNDYINNIQ
jgi:hypothetical protein